MKSLKDLLILGPGPSSSHTIGPYRIAKAFLEEIQNKEVEKVEVTLYGSLAMTGKGHATDDIIKKALEGIPSEVFFKPTFQDICHPNTMDCLAYLKDGKQYQKRFNSIGGGAYIEEGKPRMGKEVYPFSTFDGLKKYMEEQELTDIYEVILSLEGEDILSYGKDMLLHSFHTISDALEKEGTLPGPLKLKRVAKKVYNRAKETKDDTDKRIMFLTAYAYATAEANANNEIIVTAPTCGAAGVVPSVLYYEWKNHKHSLNDLAKAYLVGALVCNFIKENAAVAGAILGCQSEIGSAASFAAASLAYLYQLSSYQVEYAAEVAMEHFLGLTCDPVDGYVQIPCIERNGVASIHAYTSYLYARNISLYRKNKVSFDNVIKAMKETGDELPSDLKETSLGGLAKIIC